jgi:uncharacterized protein
MDITPLIDKNSNVIYSYGDNQFNISGTIYEYNVVVFPQKVIPWNIKSFESFSINDILPLHSELNEIDILIIGCGFSHKTIPLSLKYDIKNLKNNSPLNIEVMQTAAACRTYNVLLLEGRRIGAALIQV